MFQVVFFILCIIAGLAVVMLATSPYRLIGPAIWTFGVFIVLLACYHQVGAREVGVPVSFGHIGADMQPGVHFTAPWVEIHRCPLGQQHSVQTQAPSEGDKTGADGVNINGSDQGGATADITVLYHFSPATANALYRRYACSSDVVKSNLIRPAVKSAVPAAAAQFVSTDLKTHRTQIEDSADVTLSGILNPIGVLVDRVIVSEITLSQNVQAAADSKLQAQQAAQQAQFTLQKAQVDAQTQEVNATAAKLANDTKSQSLSAQILCQEWIDMLNAVKPSTVLTGGPCGGSVGGSPIINLPAAAAAAGH